MRKIGSGAEGRIRDITAEISVDVLDLVGPLHGRRLLEVGCRSGANLVRALNNGAIVWGVDPSAPLLYEARLRLPGADLRIGGADELPFDSGTFDLVCSFGPIVGGQAAVSPIGEMARVCRHGGLVVLTVAGDDVVDAEQLAAETAALARRHALRLGSAPPANRGHGNSRTVILMR